MATVSTSACSLHNEACIDELFQSCATETLAWSSTSPTSFLVSVFPVLCLRLIVVITNYERGDDPGSTVITVWEDFYDTLLLQPVRIGSFHRYNDFCLLS